MNNHDDSFHQAAFDAAKGFIAQLSERPDLLKLLAKEIADIAPPGSLPQRLQPPKRTR